jgi:hypothetical protein
MASLKQHQEDCRRFLGDDHQAVHVWLDACFRELGPLHRRERHHREGINEVSKIFGSGARTAAELHILRDCRHIPNREDYLNGNVDPLGLKRQWSTAAYIRYNDQDFEELVRQQLKPSALVLWAFLEWSDAKGFLAAATTLAEDQIEELAEAWQHSFASVDAVTKSDNDPAPFTEAAEDPELSDEIRTYLAQLLEQSVMEELRPSASVGMINLDSLVNPFVYLDYELLEDLKPELTGSGLLELAHFALPKMTQTPITAVGDTSQKGVTFVSRQKTMAISGVRLRATPEGTEVSYLISGNAAGIVVADLGGRYLLRNGIHRAYLLAQLGIKRIPCILMKDSNQIPFIGSPYPVFTPPVLLKPRPPLLTDFLRPELCLQAPVRRTQRVIRVSIDEISLPVD